MIGSFKIQRELGRGGMGEVFLAQDTRLERMVAIKALPAHLSSDPDRLARFQREAKVLASLSHTNIGAIYGLEESAGQQYLILEFVEGQTLADRLTRGPVPLDEALQLAMQMAEALEAAHEKGIVHRDLKPGNVMITPDGVVKVLDFGLARSESTPVSTITSGFAPDSPTITRPQPVHSPTIPGAIMGSAGYMSPEQARGKPVDKRSDVFSFGCVLYEMLTGSIPFRGETVADAIGATLHKELDLGQLPVSTPPRVRELLSMCLAKDRKQRLHDMGDARLTIERAISGQEWAQPVAAHRGRSAWPIAAFIALSSVAALGIGWLLASRFTAPTQVAPPVTKLLIPSQTPAYRWADDPRISPDGRTVVFSAVPTGGKARMLWARPLDSFDARPLSETENAESHFWSRDGRSIAFHTDGKLWAVDVEQRGSRRLITAATSNAGAAWSPDGTILLSFATTSGGILSVPASGGQPKPVTTPDEAAFERGHFYPYFLPDGQRYLYLVVDRKPEQEVNVGHLCAGTLGSSERTFIADLTSNVWYVKGGWLVFVEDGTIKAAPFDADTLKFTGDPVTIADGVSYFRPVGYASFSVADDGTLVYIAPPADNQLVWFDASGARLAKVPTNGSPQQMTISPDGSRLVLMISDRRTGLSDLWIMGLDRPSAMRLTTDASWEGAPVWSHDGSTIYFSSDRRDFPEVYSIRADGSGGIKPVYGTSSVGRIWFPASAPPDGKQLFIIGSVDKLGSEMMALPLEGGGPAVPVRSSPADEFGPSLSPDGKWLAYQSDESGRPEVYLAPFPGNGPKVQVSVGGFMPRWSPRGDKLYFQLTVAGDDQAANGFGAMRTSKIMVVELDSPAAFTAPPPPMVLFETPEEIGSFQVAPDGKRFLLLLSPNEQPPMSVILNAIPPRK